MKSPLGKLLLILVGFVAINLALFGVYRVVFVLGFAQSCDVHTVARVLAAGLRTDLALFAFELAAVGLIALAQRSFRLRFVALFVLVLSWLHLVLALANYFFFRERNLPLGEKLFAYLFSPTDLALYGGGFLLANPWVALGLALVTVATFWGGLRFSRRWHDQRLALAPYRVGIPVTVAVCAVLFLPALEVFPVKRNKLACGFRVKVLTSRHHQTLHDFVLNQAVGNPVHDLFRIYAFAALQPSYRDRLPADEALRSCQEQLGIRPTDPRYPLLRRVPGLPKYAPLGLRNVVILQIEGLSQSILEREVGGRRVMPCLARLAADGIYVPNLLQGFNATAGGVFSTVAGLPKGAFEERTRRFASYETAACYASLPYILGREQYEHLFAEGFRESYLEYVAFMSNQGFVCHGYPQVRDRLKLAGRLAGAEEAQGVFDDRFLLVCADLIAETRKPCFVAHLVTVTSHSPWVLPADFRSDFESAADRTFSYVDHAIEVFLERLDKAGKLDGTLVVVVADHTSLTYSADVLERLRIPLILHARDLRKAGLHGTVRDYGSQMDVVPTVLSLLPGDHSYAGYGRSLLAPAAPDWPILSGTSSEGWLFRGDDVVHYSPVGQAVQRYAKSGDCLPLLDLADTNPERTPVLLNSFHAFYETARRLARDQAVFPPH